jgi:hypothetical protein
VVGPEDPLTVGEQRGEQVLGSSRVTGFPGPAGEGGEGVGVVGPEDPLTVREQCGEQIPGTNRITGFPGPDGHAAHSPVTYPSRSSSVCATKD